MHPKQKIHKSKSYLKWIRQKQCLTCGAPGPNDAHHVWHTGKKNHGNDYLAVPLCRGCHTAENHSYHRLGHKQFQVFWNVDMKDEIINLLSEHNNSLVNIIS